MAVCGEGSWKRRWRLVRGSIAQVGRGAACASVLLVAPSDVLAQDACTGGTIRTLIEDIRDAIQNDNRAEALELLMEANNCLVRLPQRPPPALIDEEALRWDIAQLNLDRADTAQDDGAVESYANESIQRWKDYVRWFDGIPEDDRQLLEAAPESHRIQRAVQQLGRAIVRRGNRRPDEGLRSLFSEYAGLSAQHHSSNSIELWRYWLLRCPTWAEVSSLSLLQLRGSASLRECREQWRVFRDFLDIWHESVGGRLSELNRRTFARWLRELDEVMAEEET